MRSAEAFEENFPAVDTEVVSNDLADLEKAFWICDYEATTYGIGNADAESLLTSHRRPKDAKFGGNVEALINWWREKRTPCMTSWNSTQTQLQRKTSSYGEFPDSI